MTALLWDQVGERTYETGVDKGVLYLPDNNGVYNNGYAWNGLTTVTESPSGADATPQYADNIKYLNLVSAEIFGGTIEAFTYPDEFGQCDGSASPSPGVFLGQQGRRMFGMAYRTRKGNDIEGTEFGYKLHLVYGAIVTPSERAYGTINDSPSAIAFSWTMSTTPAPVPGYKPTSIITIDSTQVDADNLMALEEILYGTVGSDPRLPAPIDVIEMFGTTLTEVSPTAPGWNDTTNTVTIPTVTGVEYLINDEVVTGAQVITAPTVVRAQPTAGHRFPTVSDSDWFYTNA